MRQNVVLVEERRAFLWKLTFSSKQSLEFALIQTGLARKTDFILSSKYTLLGWNGSTDVLPP